MIHLVATTSQANSIVLTFAIRFLITPEIILKSTTVSCESMITGCMVISDQFVSRIAGKGAKASSLSRRFTRN